MTALLTTAVIAGSALAAWHMWLTYKGGGFSPRNSEEWTRCPCGHAAALHAADAGYGRGGCRSKDVGTFKSDPYGYCTCPASHAQVMGERAESVR